MQLSLKVLRDGHFARPDLGGQDARPTVDQELWRKVAYRIENRIEVREGFNLFLRLISGLKRALIEAPRCRCISDIYLD